MSIGLGKDRAGSICLFATLSDGRVAERDVMVAEEEIERGIWLKPKAREEGSSTVWLRSRTASGRAK